MRGNFYGPMDSLAKEKNIFGLGDTLIAGVAWQQEPDLDNQI